MEQRPRLPDNITFSLTESEVVYREEIDVDDPEEARRIAQGTVERLKKTLAHVKTKNGNVPKVEIGAEVTTSVDVDMDMVAEDVKVTISCEDNEEFDSVAMGLCMITMELMCILAVEYPRGYAGIKDKLHHMESKGVFDQTGLDRFSDSSIEDNGVRDRDMEQNK